MSGRRGGVGPRLVETIDGDKRDAKIGGHLRQPGIAHHALGRPLPAMKIYNRADVVLAVPAAWHPDEVSAAFYVAECGGITRRRMRRCADNERKRCGNHRCKEGACHAISDSGH